MLGLSGFTKSPPFGVIVAQRAIYFNKGGEDVSGFKYIREEGRVELAASGEMLDVVAEIGYMVQKIHHGIKVQNQEAADKFRKLVQIMMEDDSPTWEESPERPGAVLFSVVREEKDGR